MSRKSSKELQMHERIKYNKKFEHFEYVERDIST